MGVCRVGAAAVKVHPAATRGFPMAPAIWGAQAARGTPRRSLRTELFDVSDDRALRYLRRGRAYAGGVLRDPIPRPLNAFINASLVLAHGHRESAIAAAGERITHKTFDWADHVFHVCLSLLQQIKQLLGTLPGIGSYNRMHDCILPWGPAESKHPASNQTALF